MVPSGIAVYIAGRAAISASFGPARSARIAAVATAWVFGISRSTGTRPSLPGEAAEEEVRAHDRRAGGRRRRSRRRLGGGRGVADGAADPDGAGRRSASSTRRATATTGRASRPRTGARRTARRWRRGGRRAQRPDGRGARADERGEHEEHEEHGRARAPGRTDDGVAACAGRCGRADHGPVLGAGSDMPRASAGAVSPHRPRVTIRSPAGSARTTSPPPGRFRRAEAAPEQRRVLRGDREAQAGAARRARWIGLVEPVEQVGQGIRGDARARDRRRR